MQLPLMRRLAIIAIIAGAIASVLILGDRFVFEMRNRSVEITIDQQDLADFAHAYGYNMDELLREMRRAGLTSVAVYEELGQRVNLGNHALALSGQQLIDSARTSPLHDPLLAAMVQSGKIDVNSMYLIVYDKPTFDRYVTILRVQLEPRNVQVLRPRLPAIIAVKTQIDFFNSLGLGIPEDIAAQVRRLGLLVDPRVQNNERLDSDRIAAVFDQMLSGGRTGAVIFFGQRNEVLGYPYNLDATAENFQSHNAAFGDVEAYDPTQIQKGSITLARKIVNQTVRVQAISKIELDRLDVDTVVARYLLGVRERNIRVIYLRPFPHVIQQRQSDGTFTTLSAEATNLQMLRELRDGLEANGFHPGRAAGFINFKSIRLEVLYFIVALGAAGAFLLLLDIYGLSRSWMPWVFAVITTVAFWVTAIMGRDAFMRQVWALGAALTFAILAGTTLAPYFKSSRAGAVTSLSQDARAGLKCLLQAAGVAILGGFFVAGLLSQATFMIEVQQSLGTKLLLAAPPIILLLLYGFSPVFGGRATAGDVAGSPLRVWQFAALLILCAAAALLVARSGNQPDIGVSGFETHIRGALTALVGARPRFKEFLIGYPLIMILPALSSRHRRSLGWLVVLAAGVGLADVLDTFSHIHTPLSVTLLRIFNGLVFGAIIGFVLQWIYRLVTSRASASVKLASRASASQTQ